MKPIDFLLSFLIYPHHSEAKNIEISVNRNDLLFIPEIHSAEKTLTIENIGFFTLVGIILITLLIGLYSLFGITPLIIIFIGICISYYLFSLFFKLVLIWKALNFKIMRFSEEEIHNLKDEDLPIYTILIPLYKEAEVVGQLLTEMINLDYPEDKLDIKLLLEEDDKETINAVENWNLPSYFETIILPDSYPKTKPKSLNYGLTSIRGDYLTLYDAEDMPERDQLKKAYLAFQKLPKNVACVQAKLNYYNKDQNLLTRLFTSEYVTWFNLSLPGLQAMNYPIPLGGTSNHFEVSVLKEIGAWDPYNVTEDCDLGMRIARRNYKTAMIDSTTWEEANSKIQNWGRQRSRWMKGYLQTLFVHLRHPSRCIREFKLENFIAFLFFVGGTPIASVINLLFWLLTILWFTTHSPIIQSLFPWYVFYPALFCMVIGNFIFLYIHLIGCVHMEFYALVKWSLLVPFYWILMGLATFKSFWQLIFNAHFWEKTEHGLYLRR